MKGSWIAEVGGEKPSLVFYKVQREFGLFQPSRVVGRCSTQWDALAVFDHGEPIASDCAR